MARSDHYEKVERAIRLLATPTGRDLPLAEISRHIGLSPHYFQRLFLDWAGVTPTQFKQLLTVERAKAKLRESESILETSAQLGLSSTSRLHDSFVRVMAISPGEYKSLGFGLELTVSVQATVFGIAQAIASPRGIVHLSFAHQDEGLQNPTSLFPRARIRHEQTPVHQQLFDLLNNQCSEPGELKLILKASPFQLSVWQALLTIPSGSLASYAQVATSIGKPTAVRAVASAVARNPVAYLIPCHRVIRSTGVVGQYRWGADRKAAMIGYEAAQI